MRLAKLLCAVVLTSVLSAPALAATCNHPAGMDGFLAEFKKEAAAKGISRKGISALDGIAVDPSVLAADKRQGVFKQSFEEFSGRMISRDRMTKGLRHMHTHAATLKKGRAELRRARRRGGCAVGSRNRLRHQPRQEGSDPLGRDAGVRLPPHRDVPEPADGRAAHRRSGRSHPRRNARRLGWRLRPDPVPAVVLLQVCGRLRRRRPPRPRAQRAGRARLHRQLSEGLRLAGRQAMERRRSELRGDPRLEQGRGLRQDHRGLRRAPGRRRRPRAEEPRR